MESAPFPLSDAGQPAEGVRAPHGLAAGTRRWWAWCGILAISFGVTFGVAMWATMWRASTFGYVLLGAAVAGAHIALLFLREFRAVRLVVDAGDARTVGARFEAVALGLKWPLRSTPRGVECDLRSRIGRFILSMEVGQDSLVRLTGPNLCVRDVVRRLGGRVLGPE